MAVAGTSGGPVPQICWNEEDFGIVHIVNVDVEVSHHAQHFLLFDLMRLPPDEGPSRTAVQVDIDKP